MKMPLLATLFVHAESTFGEGKPPRLRELIVGLLSGNTSAAAVLDRLDPAFVDEIRAYVAHRGLSAENFIAQALLAFAFDIADKSWDQAIRSRRADGDDPEADVICDVLIGNHASATRSGDFSRVRSRGPQIACDVGTTPRLNRISAACDFLAQSAGALRATGCEFGPMAVASVT